MTSVVEDARLGGGRRRARPTAVDRLLAKAFRVAGRRLWSSPRQAVPDIIHNQVRAYERGVLLVRAFYAASVYWAIRSMVDWPEQLHATAVDPEWPAFWLNHLGHLGTGIGLILGGYLLAGLVAVMLPHWRVARLAYSVMLLEYMAFINGFGKINHNLHAWLYVSVILVLLPGRKRYRAEGLTDRNRFLSVIWICQVTILFVYTLTGIWKLGFAFHALVQPRVSAFEFKGFTYVIADRLIETNQQTIMGEYFVRHQLIGWALFNGTMYLEVTSLIIAFRPRLHRPWGLGLLLFHIGTYLAMGFTFLENTFLIGLFLLCSPAAPDRVRLGDALLDLPGVHVVARYLARRRRAPTAPPGPEGAPEPEEEPPRPVEEARP